MDNAGQQALNAIDKVLSEKPERVGHDFSEATRHLSVYRDELAATFRRTTAEEDRRRLEQVNSVISVIVGGHYPLGPVPWPEIETARDLLARVVE